MVEQDVEKKKKDEKKKKEKKIRSGATTLNRCVFEAHTGCKDREKVVQPLQRWRIQVSEISDVRLTAPALRRSRQMNHAHSLPPPRTSLTYREVVVAALMRYTAV